MPGSAFEDHWNTEIGQLRYSALIESSRPFAKEELMRLEKHVAFQWIVLTTLLTTSRISADNGQTARPLQVMDVFELEHASDPQISPDGLRVVYVRNSMDLLKDRPRSDVWVINSDGSEHRPLASGPLSVSHPRWSPDGTRVIYISKETVDGPTQIFCRWVDTGETTRLTHLVETPDHLTWSPMAS
jgi:Tol biopolymer transport system component